MVDVLTNLAVTLALGAIKDMTVPICGKWVVSLVEDESMQEINIMSIYEIEKENWC